MLVWKPSTVKDIREELDILNSNPEFNRLTKGKERVTREELAAEHRDGRELSAERWLLYEVEEMDGNRDRSGDHPAFGLMEYIMRNPNDGMPWLGLLVIRSDCQGRGLARQAYEGYEQRMRERGVREVLLGVVAGNERAAAFWLGRGFVPCRETIMDGKAFVLYKKDINT